MAADDLARVDAETLCMARVARDLGFEATHGEDGETCRLRLATGPNERVTFLRQANVDLNPAGSADIARDKPVASRFLELAGVPVVPTLVSQAPGDSEQLAHRPDLQQRPVVVKPARGYEGTAVYEVRRAEDFDEAVSIVRARGTGVIVQPKVIGPVCRVVVLDGEVLTATVGDRPTVTGDGNETAEQLVASWLQQQAPKVAHRVQQELHQVTWHIEQQGIGLTDKVPNSQEVEVLPCTNASRGGIRQRLAPDLEYTVTQLALDCTKHLNLRWAGVDVVVEDDRSSPQHRRAQFLEISAAPDITSHGTFSVFSVAEVEEVYRRVLQALRQSMEN